MKASVLFVCLGNICRSPLAEAAFRREAAALGLEVEIDSAGTGTWNIGTAPDKRAQAVAEAQGVDISHRRARQVTPEDFNRFDYVVALDTKNLADLQELQPPGSKAVLSLMLDHVEGREGQAVPDPYYGGPDDFAETWARVSEAAQALAQRIAVDNRID